MESEHSKNKGKDQQCIEAVLSVGIQESEQQIGPEQWEECSWLFRNLAESAKEKEVVSGKEKTQDAGKTGPGGAQRGWTSRHGWKGKRKLLAKRGVSAGTLEQHEVRGSDACGVKHPRTTFDSMSALYVPGLNQPQRWKAVFSNSGWQSGNLRLRMRKYCFRSTLR